ncbi:HK97 family phage prohead protease [Methylobrevis pamukkalensis]|uniref:Caudovirus prohead protease n=1 Tax=Methylobrevis pamukkalensis TaxID=1439726 RepID=A0A1E3GXS8_9HYPH|nr:HK97 family phage prohead protease [Methylobrevis pamukkalensis]ODN68852.1 Caudovirus prohead protease [Methylobrevis pamukkalensis]
MAHEHLDALEVRFSSPGEDGTLEGYAVRFDVVDSYRTTFDRSAFAWDGRSVPLLWSHDPGNVLGSVKSVASDASGLRVRGKLNLEIQRAREVRSMLIAGDVSGFSIGFRRLKDESRSGGVRHITKADLVEVSLVAIPSVPGSNVTSIRTGQPSTGAAAFVHALRRCALTLKG